MQERNPFPSAAQLVSDRADSARELTSSLVSLLPADFAWTDAERAEIETLARQLNCSTLVAGQLLVYLLIYISTYQKEISVAELPRILRRFPVKWGYKKKRHDFLRRVREMDFISVQTDYWAKVRAKKYGVGKAGTALLSRVLKAVFHC